MEIYRNQQIFLESTSHKVLCCLYSLLIPAKLQFEVTENKAVFPSSLKIHGPPEIICEVSVYPMLRSAVATNLCCLICWWLVDGRRSVRGNIAVFLRIVNISILRL